MNEDWIPILEITHKEEAFLNYLKDEFHKREIPYKIDLKEEWKGYVKVPKYKGKFMISVQEESKSIVEEILKEYNEKEAIESEQDELVESPKEDDTEIESKKRHQKQIIVARISAVIIMIMIISIIVAGIINS